ncbi:MAG: sulfotransferase [Candidatus Scalinduaceae bacterium]
MNNKKVPYMYITGANHSGSTLLTFLLNAHPQMMSIHEVGGPIPKVNIKKYQCSCGTLLLQCPFYLELERHINSLGSSFSLLNWQTRFQISNYRWLNIPLVRPLRNVFLERIRDTLVPIWPGYRKLIGLIGQRNAHLARAALAISGKQVFVDSQKDSIRIKFLKECDNLDLYVIHLVRDVRGGVVSIMKASNTDNVAWATRIWNTANMNSERSRQYVSPSRWLRLTYDELCADVQGTIDRISDFVGLERATVPKNFYETAHHIIGNRMRLRRSSEIRQDDSWKKRLNQHDLDIIAQIGGAENRYFGHKWP